MPPPITSNRVGPIATPRVSAREVQPPPTQPLQPAGKAEGWVATGAARPRPQVATTVGKATPAPAPKHAAEIAPDVRRDLSTFEARKRLATDASQVNPISADPKIDNADRICAGAAAVNALILNSTTPEAAKANAEALRSAMGARHVELPASLDKQAINDALDHLAAGSPSMNDVFVLQQVAYAVGRRYAQKKEAKDGKALDDGLNPAQLGGLIADLKARGATLDGNTQFSLSKQHWVAHVGAVTANSDQNVKIDSGAKLPSNKAWAGDVVLRADGVVEARTRTVRVGGADVDAAGYARAFELEPPKKDGLTRGFRFPIVPVDPNKAGDPAVSGVLLSKGDHLHQLNTAWAATVAGAAPAEVLK